MTTQVRDGARSNAANQVEISRRRRRQHNSCKLHVRATSRCRCHGNVHRQPSNYARQAFKCPTRTKAVELSAAPGAAQPAFPLHLFRLLRRRCLPLWRTRVLTMIWFDFGFGMQFDSNYYANISLAAKITTSLLKSLHAIHMHIAVRNCLAFSFLKLKLNLLKIIAARRLD